jgi:two-component system response regulator YesN
MSIIRLLKRKPNKLFLLYFFSFFIVILVPIILLSLSSYRLAYTTVLNEIRQANTNTLKQTGSSVDRMLDDIVKQSIQLGLDGRIYASSTYSDDSYLLNEVRDRITVMSNENSYVQSIQVYYLNNNLVLSSDSPNRYYKGESFDQWIELFTVSAEDQLWLPTRSFVTQDGIPYKIVTLVRKLPVAFSDTTGYIAIHVREDKLQDLLKSMDPGPNSWVYLTGEHGIVLSAFSPTLKEKEALKDTEMSQLLEQNTESSFVNRSGKNDSLVSIGTPRRNGWRLVSMTSLEYLESKLQYIRQIILLTGCLLIFLGMVMSYFLSRTMYNPIKRLLEKTKNYQRELSLPSTAEEGNSLHFVSGMVEQFFYRHKELEASYKNNYPAMIDRFLYHLFYNRTSATFDVQLKLDDLRLSLTPYGYVVMIVEIDDYFTLRDRYSSQDLNLLRYAVLNIVHEIASGPYTCLSTEINDNQVAILINLKTITDNHRESLTEMADQIIQAIRTYLTFSITISFGGVIEHLLQTHVSFQQASNVVRHKMMMDSRKTLFHEDSVYINSFHYFYPAHIEKSLVNNIRACNEGQTLECLKQLRTELKLKANLSYENVFRLYNRLIDSIIDLTVDSGLPWDKVYGASNVYLVLAKHETIESIHVWMEELCVQVIEYLRSHFQNPSKVDLVLEFIGKQFSEDISVEQIADAVQLNPAYLSRIFKQTTGKTVLEHLTLVRMEGSKILLCESTLNIHDVALRIGYNNTNSFIRFFRKYEGVTPGEYRKLHGMNIQNKKEGEAEKTRQIHK